MKTLVPLTSVTHEYEAGLIRARLKEHGIESQLVGGALADFRAECPATVDVMIRDADQAAAKTILGDFSEETDNINWDEVDVGEPESMIGDAKQSMVACETAGFESGSRDCADPGKQDTGFLLDGPIWLIVIIVGYMIVKLGLRVLSS